MQNEAGEYVDLYTPRKCSVTNNVIAAKDHASVQLSVAEIDEEGRMTGGFKTYCLCGKVRSQGESDDALANLCLRDGIIANDMWPVKFLYCGGFAHDIIDEVLHDEGSIHRCWDYETLMLV